LTTVCHTSGTTNDCKDACGGSHGVNLFHCRFDGTCSATESIECYSYVCDPALGACKNNCTSDDDCSETHYCDTDNCI